VNTYWWRLSRRGWLAGAAAGICALVILTRILHRADDVAGTVSVAHVSNMVVATGVLTLIVLIDQTTPLGPWLTADLGPRWDTGRTAWTLLGATGAGLVLLQLRDPGGRRGQRQ
jgi:tetrahydromethanopterin S-methyltransferase subunit C